MTQDQSDNNDISASSATKKPRRTTVKTETTAKTTKKASGAESTAKTPAKSPAKTAPKAASKTAKVSAKAPNTSVDASAPISGDAPKRAPRAPKKAVENTQEKTAAALTAPADTATQDAKRSVRRTPKKAETQDSVASPAATITATNIDIASHAPRMAEPHEPQREDSALADQSASRTRRTPRRPAAKETTPTESFAPAPEMPSDRQPHAQPAVQPTTQAQESADTQPETLRIPKSSQTPRARGGRGASRKPTDAPRSDLRRADAESRPPRAPQPARQEFSPGNSWANSPGNAQSDTQGNTREQGNIREEAQGNTLGNSDRMQRAPSAPLTPINIPSAARFQDDGIIAHILPPLEDHLDDDNHRKRPRRRSRRKRKGEMQPFQPEGFADIYPSAGLTSVLPMNEPFVFSDDDDFEDDGPQPTLPNQPSLALPPAADSIDDDDLEALDAAVNGNRIDGHDNRRPAGESRFGKNRNPRGTHARGATDRSGSDNTGNADKRPRQDRNERHERNDRNERPDNRRHQAVDTPGKLGRQEKPLPSAAKSAPLDTAPITATAPIDDEDDLELPDIVVPTGKRVLYVSVVPDEQVEVVITDNGLVTEYFVEMAHQAKVRGNIYKGVVNNVDTNLQAAFVNFGNGKNGFLQIDEVHPEYWLTHHDATKGPKYPAIQKAMKVGQEVLVQVVKEPAGTKGAFLTTWVSLAGRFLVLTPGQEQIGVSRKVEDPEERSRLKELLAGIDPGEDMGVIIRTASEGASKTSIQKDLQYLKRLWKDIRKRVGLEKAPALLHQEADLASRAVRDYLAEDIMEIWVDDESTLGSIREMTSLLFPRRTDMVKLHQDPRQTLWERFNLQRQLEEVTSREVVLPSGGRLVFDQTEALMAIDINSGKTQGKSNFEAMVFRTNMEAAEAIARHLRLRDIGGQVVIDFIEMRDRNHSRDVEKALRNAMRLDRARHDVGRMSSFGLLELVRQRTGTSAISISSEPCPHCRGTGVRRNMEWQALQALRDLQAKLVKTAGQSPSAKNRKYDPDAVKLPFLHELDFELGLYLLNRKRDRLLELESRFCVKIEIQLKGA